MRYFFNVRHDGLGPDREGTELNGLYAARVEAVRLAGTLLQEHPEEFWVDDDWLMEVADATGLILFTIVISAADAPAIASLGTSSRDTGSSVR